MCTNQRFNLILFIQRSGLKMSKFAELVFVSPSTLSQIVHGGQEGTFLFWSVLADQFNLNLQQLVKLYELDYSCEEIIADYERVFKDYQYPEVET